MKDSVTIWCLLCSVLACNLTNAQQLGGGATSSVQWINLGVHPLATTINEIEVTSSWRSGGIIGGGGVEVAEWRAAFVPPQPAPALDVDFVLDSGRSIVGVIVGDFAKQAMSGESELANGYTRIGTEVYRVGLIKLPLSAGRPARSPIYFVNSLADEVVTFSVAGGATHRLSYGQTAKHEATMKQFIKLAVTADGLKKTYTVAVEEGMAGIIVGAYRKGLDGAAQVLLNPLDSIESVRLREQLGSSDADERGEQ